MADFLALELVDRMFHLTVRAARGLWSLVRP
jgi:hypothetical protein